MLRWNQGEAHYHRPTVLYAIPQGKDIVKSEFCTVK